MCIKQYSRIQSYKLYNTQKKGAERVYKTLVVGNINYSPRSLLISLASPVSPISSNPTTSLFQDGLPTWSTLCFLDNQSPVRSKRKVSEFTRDRSSVPSSPRISPSKRSSSLLDILLRYFVTLGRSVTPNYRERVDERLTSQTTNTDRGVIIILCQPPPPPPHTHTTMKYIPSTLVDLLSLPPARCVPSPCRNKNKENMYRYIGNWLHTGVVMRLHRGVYMLSVHTGLVV